MSRRHENGSQAQHEPCRQPCRVTTGRREHLRAVGDFGVDRLDHEIVWQAAATTAARRRSRPAATPETDDLAVRGRWPLGKTSSARHRSPHQTRSFRRTRGPRQRSQRPPQPQQELSTARTRPYTSRRIDSARERRESDDDHHDCEQSRRSSRRKSRLPREMAKSTDNRRSRPTLPKRPR